MLIAGQRRLHWWWSLTRGFTRLVVVIGLMLGVDALSVPSQASATLFHRGDIFAVTTSGVQEYTPTGQLIRTIPGTSGARVLCFDPSGQHLMLPGIGLFDSSGNLLPSHWASAPVGASGSGVDCVADGFGNVYADGRSSPMTKYDLNGNALQSFNVVGGFQFAMDLAPDECTMYDSVWAGPLSVSGPFNVCTNTQEFDNSWQLVDDLRVLPNWQVLRLGDYSASLLDTSGRLVRAIGLPSSNDGFRNLALDPDGTSFWVCCAVDLNPPYVSNVYRFDINSGQILAAWPLDSGAIAVYSPPLLGDANVEGGVDSNTAGRAEAFQTTVGYSGHLTHLHLWVDSSSTANRALVGIYSDKNGRPFALQRQAAITSVLPGSWNYVDLPSMSVRAGQRYWIAVLVPTGGGAIILRDSAGDGAAETSAQRNLTGFRARWSDAAFGGSSTRLSAYGN
jgi:hypothetical protein